VEVKKNRIKKIKSSVSDPDPHSIGRPGGGLKRAKIKKKCSKKPNN
jgi:hypothetical protein